MLRRNPSLSVSEIEGETFLVEPESGEIYYLDAITSGVWRILATPCPVEEVIATYTAAFPETPAAQVEEDVRRVIAEMLDSRLLLGG